ncbi:hypothetical protein [Olivibacter sp. XZL3]|uniref:hypothetical protein n=1 Tax=Olivibacter sp. XZL3 TaxID=1735116 RepID=UPI001417086B|nr:hypothetical protein [Olivibacter sp. XZL3]
MEKKTSSVQKEETQDTKKRISPKVQNELKDRSESFADKKHSRKHDSPKTSRNPKGFA